MASQASTKVSSKRVNSRLNGVHVRTDKVNIRPSPSVEKQAYPKANRRRRRVRCRTRQRGPASRWRLWSERLATRDPPCFRTTSVGHPEIRRRSRLPLKIIQEVGIVRPSVRTGDPPPLPWTPRKARRCARTIVGLLAAGKTVASHGLVLVAIGMLSLIVLAVRNSWAIAVDVVSTPRQED